MNRYWIVAGLVLAGAAALQLAAREVDPPPRIDRVSLKSISFPTAQHVAPVLYVQGANAAPNAAVLVDGAVQPTMMHRTLTNDLLGVQPSSLARPIASYRSFMVPLGQVRAGAVVRVQIRNPDGQTSGSIGYELPRVAAEVDSDGDDIPDVWELNGYDADNDGTVDVDLPALGAHPFRPDIFVEVDIMLGLDNPPSTTVFNTVRNAFAAAPIINPQGANGINLVVDASGSVPFVEKLSIGFSTPGNFYEIKDFDEATRGRIYHYCIWGNMQPGAVSGASDMEIANNDISGPGDDFLISMDDFSAGKQTVRSQAEVFMHELGHNLQLRHGGFTHDQFNPVHNSVMSYSWVHRTGFSAAARKRWPVYAPFYYGVSGAVEVNGNLPPAIGPSIGYSEGMGRNLNESALHEPQGLFNSQAIDWDGNGAITNSASADANCDGFSPSDPDCDGDENDQLRDHPNWTQLVYSGPRRGGRHE